MPFIFCPLFCNSTLWCASKISPRTCLVYILSDFDSNIAMQMASSSTCQFISLSTFLPSCVSLATLSPGWLRSLQTFYHLQFDQVLLVIRRSVLMRLVQTCLNHLCVFQSEKCGMVFINHWSIIMINYFFTWENHLWLHKVSPQSCWKASNQVLKKV